VSAEPTEPLGEATSRPAPSPSAPQSSSGSG
jgi:hypothetical protein